MSVLTWDATGTREYHSGVSKAVLFPQNTDGTYAQGVAWSGITGIDDSPDGAEANDFYADNIKYASLRSAENHKGSISAYDWPDEWRECDGSKAVEEGLYIGQQKRKPFGLVYRTEVGNDANPEAGYVLHFVWNATVSPTEKTHETINENPDLPEYDWDYDCLPVPVSSVANAKPVSTMEADSRKLSSAKMKAIEDQIYGTESVEPAMPTPDQLIALVAAATGATGATGET